MNDMITALFVVLFVVAGGVVSLWIKELTKSKWYADYKLRRQAKREERMKEIEAKKVKKAADELQKIASHTKDTIGTLAVPPSLPEGATVTQGEVQSLTEFPIGQKIDIELTRLVEGTFQRVTVAKGKVAIKSGTRPIKLPNLLFFVWQKGAQYFINPKKILKITVPAKGKKPAYTTYKLVYDILLGEALNKDGTVTWDDDLEMILADSTLDQHVTIAAFEGSFHISPALRNAMIVIAVLGLMLGIALNGVEHFIPTTQIHWVP